MSEQISEQEAEAPAPTAQLLQNLHQKSGLSYQDIADKVGTSKTTVSEVMNTGRGQQLSKVLEVLRAAP